ncbi:MAG: RecX family transcriptional regulator, partial [Solobacterium sp.]|nr:RecX family transcriptional regulator [Solobacterium sp.]
RAKPDSDLYKRRQKVIASLVRKGYSWEMAKEACSTAETDM